MKKSYAGLLGAAGVIATVFGIAGFYWWWSGGARTDDAAERRAAEQREIRTLVSNWPQLDAAARQAALPKVANVWQFGDDELRWQACFLLGNAGPDAVPLLLPALHDPDDDVRMYAVWALGIQGADAHAALPEVSARLKDPSPFVRQAGIFAVRRIAASPEEAVPALVTLLGDADLDIRFSVGREIARFGPGAVPPVRKLLADPSIEVRRQAVVTLGLIGPDAAAAVPDLLALLRDPQAGLQDDTSEALAGIGAPALSALADALEPERDSALRKIAILALARAGQPAVPLLTGVLTDRDPSVRLQAVTALGRIGPAAVPALVNVFKNDPDTEVRQEAARVFGSMKADDPGVLPALSTALQDSADAVRGQAIQSLRQLTPADEALIKELTPVLADKNLDVRLDAIRFLGGLGPAAVPPLVALLRDPEVKVRQRVIESLEEIRAPADVLFPPLAALLKDASATTRQNAVNILWRCGPQGVPLLREALKDMNDLVRVAAVWSLHQALQQGYAEPKEMFPVLVPALQDPHATVRGGATVALSRFGAQALPHLEGMLKDSDPGVRQYTVLALQNLQANSQAVLGLLVQAQQDENPGVRAAAAVALAQFGPPAVPHLLAALKDKDESVWKKATEGLVKVQGGKSVAVELSKALQDESLPVRQGAAYALHRFGADAVAPLIEALKDKAPGVVREAADSLKAIGPEANSAMAPLAVLAVESNDARVRQTSVLAMLSITGQYRFRDDPAKAVPNLIKLLDSPDPDNRLQAALLLGVLGPTAKDAAPTLLKVAQDRDPRVRQAAVAALERIK